MDADASTAPSQSYTILRIKRKRNEEPLDALVIERGLRRKKTRSSVGVFQYAETVESCVWKDENFQKDIQDRISRLAREDAAKEETVTSPSVASSFGDMTSSPARRRHEQNRLYTVVSAKHEPYVKHSPPKTTSSKDLCKDPISSDFKMYDAILSEGGSMRDPEMEKFLPLLNDYLKNTLATSPCITSGTGTPINESSSDYVWDVFYHRPASLSEWNSVAARTGTITGLPSSLLNSDDSDSGSEAEDEADEDSNAEEYYKNDYPDEDYDSESASDEFHEESDYDDMMHCDEEDF